jgi:hypothetical protein
VHYCVCVWVVDGAWLVKRFSADPCLYIYLYLKKHNSFQKVWSVRSTSLFVGYFWFRAIPKRLGTGRIEWDERRLI